MRMKDPILPKHHEPVEEKKKRHQIVKKKKKESKKANDAKNPIEKEKEKLEKSKNPVKNILGFSIGLTALNLSSRILLVVVIAVPYALKEAGFGLGVVLIIGIAFLTDYTLGLLIQASELTGEDTYVGVVRKVWGKWGVASVVFKQFGYPFIMMIASNVIITDIISKFIVLIVNENDLSGIQDNFYGRRDFIITSATVVITLPLSLYKNIGSLSKWAACSMTMLLVLLIFVAVRLATLDLPSTPDAYGFADVDVGRAIGILIAAFMCQHSSFLIFQSLIKPTDTRKREVVHISIAVAMLAALAFGVTGYATFTQNTEANLLNNYCTNDTLMNVGRGLFVVSVLLAFPGEVVIARYVIEATVFKNRQPTPLWRHVIITFMIVAASVGFSFLTDCLNIVLELNGVTNAAPLAFVLPPMLILKLRGKPYLTTKNLPLIAVLILGTAVTLFGVFLSIKTIIDGVECSHGEEPAFC